MAFERRMQFAAPQFLLEGLAPLLEYCRSRIVEPEERYRLEFIALRQRGFGGQFVQMPKRLPCGAARGAIGIAIHVAPFRLLIGPYEQAEPLNQSVVASAAIARGG